MTGSVFISAGNGILGNNVRLHRAYRQVDISTVCSNKTLMKLKSDTKGSFRYVLLCLSFEL